MMAKLTGLTPAVGRLQSRVSYLKPARRMVGARGEDRSDRRFYGTKRWQRLRWKILQRDLFTCAKCGRVEGNTSLLVADHIVPHRGDEALIWDEGNLQCLCKRCHDSVKQREERAARREGGV